MKTYRVVLSMLGPTYIDADGYQDDPDGFIRFYRGSEVFATYARISVKEIQESPLSRLADIAAESTDEG